VTALAAVTTRSPRLDETLVEARTAGGMPVVVVPKPGYLKSVALLTVSYGAVDQVFALPGEPAPTATPAGVAHFLEHKLFEDQAGDIFDQFARIGAQANAYTGHHETGYYFSTTERFFDALELLLDFPTDPFFTVEAIEKERAVIAQEIRMVEDDADARGHRALLRALYHRHPVKDEVAGTEASIGQIDKAMLERCHRAFYRPSDLLLVVVGDLDPAQVLARAEANEVRRTKERGAPLEGPVARAGVDEPPGVLATTAAEAMPVSAPRVLVGWKVDPPPLGPPLLRRTVETLLLLELAFGRSSAFYEQHYASGLIDGSFSHAWDAGRSGYAYVLAGGETPDPDGLVAALDARIAQVRRDGLAEADFARLRAKAYGQFVRSWNGVEQIAGQVATARSQGWDVFGYPALVESIRLEDVLARAADLDAGRRAVSVVRPA
jgi:predicted Zn-dependent peptidase